MIKLPECGLVFEEGPHLYKLNGMILPSVTQIMTPMSMMLYKGVGQQTLSMAADRGTRVHESIEHIIKYGIEEYDEDTAPYVSAFKAFSQHVHPEFVASEYRMYHKFLRYAGTADIVGYITPDDGCGVDIVDVKTTSKLQTVMLQTQLSAYAECLRSHGVKVRHVYGLHLTKDGMYKLEKIDERYQLFLHCIGIYNAMCDCA